MTQAAQAPVTGVRLSRYDIENIDDEEFAVAFGHDPWEVVEVVPIEDRPGWVTVYVQSVDPVASAWGDVGFLSR